MTARQKEQTDYPVRVIRNIAVPRRMASGSALRCICLTPPMTGLFQRSSNTIPIAKTITRLPEIGARTVTWPRKGYVGVRVDVRGTGASEGIAENEYTTQEQQDCLQALAWLADQPWCTGNLGMYGSSYGGITALQAAMHAPPRLKAIAAMHALVDRYMDDVHYHGGCLPVNESVAWAGRMVALNALPPLPEIVGERRYTLWRDRLERTPQWPGEWLRHQTRDAYWRRGSLSGNWEAIQ